MKIIDLRSDTITLPTEEMRLAMYEAEVGDDVFREDPAINTICGFTWTELASSMPPLPWMCPPDR